ncbi:MAG: hypothetical protein HY927_00915 [Elusimicrobia bacterium]|nr:hypothetical protein [Elusimicrobiota bacterium]
MTPRAALLLLAMALPPVSAAGLSRHPYRRLTALVVVDRDRQKELKEQVASSRLGRGMDVDKLFADATGVVRRHFKTARVVEKRDYDEGRRGAGTADVTVFLQVGCPQFTLPKRHCPGELTYDGVKCDVGLAFLDSAGKTLATVTGASRQRFGCNPAQKKYRKAVSKVARDAPARLGKALRSSKALLDYARAKRR